MNWVYDVVTAVARAEGVEPSQLSPLYDAIDPDVVDRLLTDATAAFELTFVYEGYSITLYRDRFYISSDAGVEETVPWEPTQGPVLGE